VAEAGADIVLLCGPEMKALATALPQEIEARYAESVEELAALLAQIVRPGDVVMVKSSNGLGFSRLVDLLIRGFPAEAGEEKRA